jgi:hypothetical protein
MADQVVPPALADVVGPLREADEYARLQSARQLGLYTLLVGLPAFFLPGVSPFGLLRRYVDGPQDGIPWLALAFTLVQWILFVLACFAPQLALPAIRRARPDWESPLLASSLLKKASEKQFWFQLPCILAYLLALAVAMLVDLVIPGVTLFQASMALGGMVHLVVMPIMAWQARRTGDPTLARLYRTLMVLAVPVFVLVPFASTYPWIFLGALVALAQSVVLPSIVLGLYRLFAPRRWLVK